MITKICYICKTEKPIECFGKLSSSKDGYRNKCKECRKQEYFSNVEYNKKRCNANYYAKHEENKAKQREYNHKRAAKQREYMRNYYDANKSKIKENVRKNSLKRKHEDVGYRILCNCRTRIYKAIKGIDKPKKTIELIGCSVDELKQYLESHFKQGMTWDNYGEWHIDHIKPCSAFNLLNENEMKKCFNYKNLQPLWAKENLQKSNKYEGRADL